VSRVGLQHSFDDAQPQLGMVDISSAQGKTMARVVDLDVDIGADAVDYKYVTFGHALNHNLTCTS
jgi:hypothetical protein